MRSMPWTVTRASCRITLGKRQRHIWIPALLQNVHTTASWLVSQKDPVRKVYFRQMFSQETVQCKRDPWYKSDALSTWHFLHFSVSDTFSNWSILFTKKRSCEWTFYLLHQPRHSSHIKINLVQILVRFPPHRRVSGSKGRAQHGCWRTLASSAAPEETLTMFYSLVDGNQRQSFRSRCDKIWKDLPRMRNDADVHSWRSTWNLFGWQLRRASTSENRDGTRTSASSTEHPVGARDSMNWETLHRKYWLLWRITDTAVLECTVSWKSASVENSKKAQVLFLGRVQFQSASFRQSRLLQFWRQV